MLYRAEFYKELESLLSKSTFGQRKKWATIILEKKIDIKDLCGLIKNDQKTAVRFLWLLSDVAILNPNYLFIELPFLLRFCDNLNPAYKTSFASYWLYTGVPSVNEGEAIDLLFQWLLSCDTNITIKSRSLMVLFKITEKYPELNNELGLCLKDQINKNTVDFKKRASKVLSQLEQK